MLDEFCQDKTSQATAHLSQDSGTACSPLDWLFCTMAGRARLSPLYYPRAFDRQQELNQTLQCTSRYSVHLGGLCLRFVGCSAASAYESFLLALLRTVIGITLLPQCTLPKVMPMCRCVRNLEGIWKLLTKARDRMPSAS